MAVTNQPGIYAKPDFQTGLCSFWDDFGICICGLFCFPCLSYSLASDMEECCLCGINMAIRSVYRTRYNIKGSLCGDWCAYSFCMVCAVCQLKRDIKRRKEQGIF